MRTPQERYESDPVFHALVDSIHRQIERAELTPSEVREAAVLACIHYEQRRRPRAIVNAAEECPFNNISCDKFLCCGWWEPARPKP
jgi:hypothetical protein